VITPDEVAAGIRIVRAEEAWQSVVFAGMIPIVGALAVGLVIWRAVKANPENDPPPETEKEGGAERGGPEDPPPPQ